MKMRAAFFFLFVSVSCCTADTIQVSGTISTNTTWRSSNVYLLTADVTVASGATLTLEAGVIVKFGCADIPYSNNTTTQKRKLVVDGALISQGTASQPVIFTSERDDVHGGDSNGDQNGTSPGRGDWGYVRINASGSVVEYCQFWYGGLGYAVGSVYYGHTDYDTRMLWVSGKAIQINHCLFAYAYHRAVYYSDSTFGAQSVIAFSEFLQCPVGIEYYGDPVMSTRMTISGNEFHDGTTGILVSRNGAALSITRNSFVSLSSYGVQNTSGSAIVAQNNWWGNASGPSGSGTGSGVPVSANVDYQNWWTSASADQNGVWNVIAQRRGESQVVDIYYDLVGQAGTTYTVTVKVSATGG